MLKLKLHNLHKTILCNLHKSTELFLFVAFSYKTAHSIVCGGRTNRPNMSKVFTRTPTR